MVVVGVYKMSSSRVKSLRVDTTRLRKLSSRQSVCSGCGGGIKCRRVMSSHYEWTGLVLGNSRVDRVRFSIKAVFVVFVVGYKMSSSRVKSLLVDTTRLREFVESTE